MTKAMAPTGTQVLGGRYALREILGTGGMATVWRATDDVLGRDVAVKVLNPEYAHDAGFLARFSREARNVAALSSSRVVAVYDRGVDDKTPYIVMELVSGRTLRQVLDDGGALAPAEAIRRRHRGLRGAGGGARGWHRSPRHKARQYRAVRPRGEGSRLRDRPD